MASLEFATGVPSHPQISIDQLDLENGRIVYRWIGGPYAGACADEFVLTIAEHGGKTVSEVVQEIIEAMIAKLPAPQE